MANAALTSPPTTSDFTVFCGASRKPFRMSGVNQPTTMSATEAASLLAWISTERNSPHIMFTQRPIFQPFRPKFRYPKWCSDSLIARRLFASHRYDFPIIGTPTGRMTPGRVVNQSTILANEKQQIPESHESLGNSNVKWDLLPWSRRQNTESNES